jgi:hypothetical protein
MFHSVIQVIPTKDFKVYVYFDDGKIKRFDMAPFLSQGVFKQISDVSAFLEKCTVMHGTLAWDVGGSFDETQCIDIDAETIYMDGIDVVDPLADRVA